jgi:tetratricopeptide (TPR) repeat protein
MAELELTGEAEEMLKQYVAAAEMKTPAAVLTLAHFMARHQNRVGDALALCSKSLAKVSPEVVARVAVAIVRVPDANGGHYAQAEAIIAQAAHAKPESVDISVSLADLRDAQGRYAEAEQKYRDILARAPRNTLAMNNLAWLLALNGGDRTEALRKIDEAIDIRGPEGNLLDTRGVILLTAGDTAQAVSVLTAAVAQDPQRERYFHLAQAQEKAGNTLEAMRAMRKARELGLTKKDLHRLEAGQFDVLIGLVGGPSTGK